jgi:hypothetical protein
MPAAEVLFFKEGDEAPLLTWLDGLPKRAQAKCIARIERLTELGHELRRPEADFLRDGIYELRIGLQGLNYRILYFFHGKRVAVLSHGLIKEKIVPPKEIDLAIKRKEAFEGNPDKYTYTGE